MNKIPVNKALPANCQYGDLEVLNTHIANMKHELASIEDQMLCMQMVNNANTAELQATAKALENERNNWKACAQLLEQNLDVQHDRTRKLEQRLSKAQQDNQVLAKAYLALKEQLVKSEEDSRKQNVTITKLLEEKASSIEENKRLTKMDATLSKDVATLSASMKQSDKAVKAERKLNKRRRKADIKSARDCKLCKPIQTALSNWNGD